jgi:hypothetical protein
MKRALLSTLAILFLAGAFLLKHTSTPIKRGEAPQAMFRQKENGIAPDEPKLKKRRPSAVSPRRHPVQFENLGDIPESSFEARMDRVARYYASEAYIQELLERERELDQYQVKKEDLISEGVLANLDSRKYKLPNGGKTEILSSADGFLEQGFNQNGDYLYHRSYRHGKLDTLMFKDSYKEPGVDGKVPDLYYSGNTVEQNLSFNEDGSLKELVTVIGDTTIQQVFENNQVSERTLVRQSNDDEEAVPQPF